MTDSMTGITDGVRFREIARVLRERLGAHERPMQASYSVALTIVAGSLLPGRHVWVGGARQNSGILL